MIAKFLTNCIDQVDLFNIHNNINNHCNLDQTRKIVYFLKVQRSINVMNLTKQILYPYKNLPKDTLAILKPRHFIYLILYCAFLVYISQVVRRILWTGNESNKTLLTIIMFLPRIILYISLAYFLHKIFLLKIKDINTTRLKLFLFIVLVTCSAMYLLFSASEITIFILLSASVMCFCVYSTSTIKARNHTLREIFTKKNDFKKLQRICFLLIMNCIIYIALNRILLIPTGVTAYLAANQILTDSNLGLLIFFSRYLPFFIFTPFQAMIYTKLGIMIEAILTDSEAELIDN